MPACTCSASYSTSCIASYDAQSGKALKLTSLQEAMRMLPVLADGTNRTTHKDVIVGGYRIPKNTMIWIPFAALFNSPANWEEPERYWPVSCAAQSIQVNGCLHRL